MRPPIACINRQEQLADTPLLKSAIGFRLTAHNMWANIDFRPAEGRRLVGLITQ